MSVFLFCSLLLNVVALHLLESTYPVGQAVINHHCCQWAKIQREKTIECLGLQNSSGFWMTTLINNITFIWEFVYAPLTNSAQVCGLTVYLCNCLRKSAYLLLGLKEAGCWVWIRAQKLSLKTVISSPTKTVQWLHHRKTSSLWPACGSKPGVLRTRKPLKLTKRPTTVWRQG